MNSFQPILTPLASFSRLRVLWGFVLLAGFFLVPSSLAFAAEAGSESGIEKETMFTLIKKGGWVMIPLGIASIIALALTVERLISLRRDKVLPAGFLDGLGQAWHEDPSGQAAELYCDQSGGAVGHVFKAGIQWRDYGYEAVNRAIEDAGSRETDRMKRSLRGLAAIAAVSPLLGLLGTVYGMIDAFQRTSASGGAAKTADLATGIYEALVTTAAGLTLAIPAMLIFQFLSARVDGLIDYIDEVGTAFIVKHARIEMPQLSSPELESGEHGEHTHPTPAEA
jgi:biopolymer transport protein ExbB